MSYLTNYFCFMFEINNVFQSVNAIKHIEVLEYDINLLLSFLDFTNYLTQK